MRSWLKRLFGTSEDVLAVATALSPPFWRVLVTVTRGRFVHDAAAGAARVSREPSDPTIALANAGSTDPIPAAATTTMAEAAISNPA
jgi:hypothetical protein